MKKILSVLAVLVTFTITAYAQHPVSPYDSNYPATISWPFGLPSNVALSPTAADTVYVSNNGYTYVTLTDTVHSALTINFETVSGLMEGAMVVVDITWGTRSVQPSITWGTNATGDAFTGTTSKRKVIYLWYNGTSFLAGTPTTLN